MKHTKKVLTSLLLASAFIFNGCDNRSIIKDKEVNLGEDSYSVSVERWGFNGKGRRMYAKSLSGDMLIAEDQDGDGKVDSTPVLRGSYFAKPYLSSEMLRNAFAQDIYDSARKKQ